MQMLRNKNALLSEGTIETKQTSIGGDAKIVFAILSGMVTDSIEYSIREPGTNAWEANLKRPFEVTVPTRFDNTIRWRDFGKGLSHAFMMNRYAKIGESTKDQDDQAVGGWGFGSKSPLAYLMHQDGAGAFGVISRHQGMRRAYVIAINARGKIEISCLAEEVMDETDRGTGLEVSFPVQEKDIERFVQYVDRIYWGFSPAPVVLPANPERPALGRGTVKAKGSNWSLYAENSGYASDTRVSPPWSGPHIRVGCVLYPVRLELLDGLTGFFTEDDNLLMEAAIGSVDVSTSREQLSYTDRTKAALSELFQQYEHGLIANIQTEVDKQTTYFDACKVAHAGCDVLGWDRTKELFHRISWNGVPCREYMFNDTSPNTAIRVCPIGRGYGCRETFKATGIFPHSLAGATIAVEHSAYRSVERLEHAGLVDNTRKVLWVRCKRDALPMLYAQLGITAADVVILDNIKLPKRVINPADADKPKTKIRIRKQLSWSGTPTTDAVDMLAGGLYVTMDAAKGRRHDYNYMYPCGVLGGSEKYKAVRKDYMSNKFMMPFAQLDLLTEEDRERPILIRKEGETLEGDWISLGDFMKSKIDDVFDVAQVTPRFSWNKDSFDSQLHKLAVGFNKTNFPATVLDLCARTNVLLAQVLGVKQEDTFNEHDKMLDFLKILVPGTQIPETTNPSSAINVEWAAYAALHPMLQFALSEMYCRGAWSSVRGEYAVVPTAKEQSLVDDYFALALAAGR